MALMDASEAGATQAQSPELQGVVSQLRAEFEAGPIEDGITHPAEQIVANHLPSLMQISPERLLAELEAEHGTDFCSSLLQCLGRCDLPSSLASPVLALSSGVVGIQDSSAWTQWRQQLLSHCLTSQDIVMRDAAIQAAEEWEDPALLSTLESHRERVPWLRDYLADVMSELASR